MKAGTGLLLALAIAAPATARSADMQPRTAGLPASAIAAGHTGANALDEGRLALAGANPAEAISAFRIALAQAPQSVAALNGLAVAYDRLGRSDLARQHFEMALALEPDAPDIAYNLGLALVRAGQDRAAIPHLQRAAMGRDARAAAAARRTLAQVAARLATPPAPVAVMAPTLATAAAAGSRIDMASSGEAVLVLAPSIPSPPAAPIQTQMPPMPPTPVRLAAVEPALAARLGDAAALTIPIALPAEAPPASSPAAPAQRPEPRRFASRTPALAVPVPPEQQPPEQPTPALPALAHASPTRLPAIATELLRGWREAAVGRLLVAGRRETPQPAPFPEQLPAQMPDDRTALIRQAIARLESLLALIEVQHG